MTGEAAGKGDHKGRPYGDGVWNFSCAEGVYMYAEAIGNAADISAREAL